MLIPKIFLTTEQQYQILSERRNPSEMSWGSCRPRSLNYYSVPMYLSGSSFCLVILVDAQHMKLAKFLCSQQVRNMD
jgi:hypothetical protein